MTSTRISLNYPSSIGLYSRKVYDGEVDAEKADLERIRAKKAARRKSKSPVRNSVTKKRVGRISDPTGKISSSSSSTKTASTTEPTKRISDPTGNSKSSKTSRGMKSKSPVRSSVVTKKRISDPTGSKTTLQKTAAAASTSTEPTRRISDPAGMKTTKQRKSSSIVPKRGTSDPTGSNKKKPTRDSTIGATTGANYFERYSNFPRVSFHIEGPSREQVLSDEAAAVLKAQQIAQEAEALLRLVMAEEAQYKNRSKAAAA